MTGSGMAEKAVIAGNRKEKKGMRALWKKVVNI